MRRFHLKMQYYRGKIPISDLNNYKNTSTKSYFSLKICIFAKIKTCVRIYNVAITLNKDHQQTRQENSLSGSEIKTRDSLVV